MPTVVYSRADSLEIKLDYDVPHSITSVSLGAVVYLHGGGIISGSRRDVFYPSSMKEAVLKSGAIFMGADYRLLYPSTGFDIIEDMKTLLSFLADPKFSEDHLPSGISLDASRIALIGASGGAYPAMAAGLYAHPKPTALLLLFGMGGDMLGDGWVKPKDGFMPFPGAESVSESSLSYLLERIPAPVSEAPVMLRSDQTIRDDENRIALYMHWWKTGELLDYVVGKPISADLRALPASERICAVPVELRPVILQAHLDVGFPPTCLVHGELDAVVEPAESQLTFKRLQELGVKTDMLLVPGAAHALCSPENPAELAVGAEEAYGKGLNFILGEICCSTY